jgi:hypothetical protein
MRMMVVPSLQRIGGWEMMVDVKERRDVWHQWPITVIVLTKRLMDH